jgi:biopolymer transport protein ExbB/TolQ
MSRSFPTEFVYQIASLLIGFIIVHATYVAVIRPNAEIAMAEQNQLLQENPDYIPHRSYFVVVRDYEQEACFVLMIWALAILAFKGIVINRQQAQLDEDFIGVSPGEIINTDGVAPIASRIRKLPLHKQNYLLPRVLLGALSRFSATANVQDASTVVHNLCESEAERLDSQLSIIRYIAWAIPSIGFIGTVRGIGDALAQAHRAVGGDITGVTESLGVAFNSTFIALVLSIVLMFIIHQVQSMQERLVLDTERYSDDWLLRRLKA